jgi:TRAP-type C4-dicarboxylate transport system substrate-binding protein
MEAAESAEERGWKMSQEVGAEAVKTLAAHGVTVVEPSAELAKELQQVGQDMIASWVERAGDDGKELVNQVK